MHTPGPWIVQSVASHGDTVAVVRGGLRSKIAVTHKSWICDEHGGTTTANARLIAKAPDLRDALQNLLTAIHNRENNPGFASAGNYVRALERARALLED